MSKPTGLGTQELPKAPSSQWLHYRSGSHGQDRGSTWIQARESGWVSARDSHWMAYREGCGSLPEK